MSELSTLTKKHRLFVEAYAGDEISAMLAAGFIGAPGYLKQQAEKFLADPIIIEAIKARSRYTAKTFAVIADREERQATLTAVMRNEDPHYREEKDANNVPLPIANIPLATRLKALELLGKSEGDFVENVNVHHSGTIAELIMDSYRVTDSVEDIEAEYRRVKNPSPLPEIEAPAPSLKDFL